MNRLHNGEVVCKNLVGRSHSQAEHKELTIRSVQDFVTMVLDFVPFCTGNEALYEHGLNDCVGQRELAFLLFHIVLL